MTYCMFFIPKVNQESSKPRLVPLNEGGVSELLNKVNPDPRKLRFGIWSTFIFQIISTQRNATPVFLPRSPGDHKTTGGKREAEIQTAEPGVPGGSTLCPRLVCLFF